MRFFSTAVLLVTCRLGGLTVAAHRTAFPDRNPALATEDHQPKVDDVLAKFEKLSMKEEGLPRGRSLSSDEENVRTVAEEAHHGDEGASRTTEAAVVGIVIRPILSEP